MSKDKAAKILTQSEEQASLKTRHSNQQADRSNRPVAGKLRLTNFLAAE
jgi:hypothetical protein